jgi:hypothetical protein
LKFVAALFHRRHSSPIYDTYEWIPTEDRQYRPPALHFGTEENHGRCLPGQRLERTALRRPSRRELSNFGFRVQCEKTAKKEPRPCYHGRGIYLATTYSHRTYRPTTIGAEAFHFRVRNGTGWFHLALVTRGRPLSKRAGSLGIGGYEYRSYRSYRTYIHLISARTLTSTWRFF